MIILFAPPWQKTHHAPEQAFKILAQIKDFEILSCVINNIHCPIYILEELAKHPDIDIVCEVAKNPRTPIPTLINIFNKIGTINKLCVIENKSLPLDILIGYFSIQSWFTANVKREYRERKGFAPKPHKP